MEAHYHLGFSLCRCHSLFGIVRIDPSGRHQADQGNRDQKGAGGTGVRYRSIDQQRVYLAGRAGKSHRLAGGLLLYA